MTKREFKTKGFHYLPDADMLLVPCHLVNGPDWFPCVSEVKIGEALALVESGSIYRDVKNHYNDVARMADRENAEQVKRMVWGKGRNV